MKITRNLSSIVLAIVILLSGCSSSNTTLHSSSQNIHNQTKNTSSNQQSSNTHHNNLLFDAKVERVIDGDTLKINFNGRSETVRLLLIDTPETVHPHKPVEPFGKEASNFTKQTLPSGSTIQVELGIGERDKYGRLLAYIYMNGKMINEQLLEKGLARVAYVYPPNTKHIDEFRDIQSKAQKKAIGIWSIENYVTDRGFNDHATKQSGNNKQTTSSSPNTTNTPSSNQQCKKVIKGNITSSGKKIYHVPGGQYYQITKPEQTFCTEEEAQKAGYRKSMR
ncbi:thermonuclease family protein [Bacillus sp. RG28]|uniref:Thermonuclease family protein n=1 Tax=Gottfriedia endophytica TaxID=2820819 RepID=A0A940SJX1_9BACI|nr:thermonuclease family protein [Gottfriedia endophytica]MBP0724668.1 thermonuclease family protein [Gottfriedia endophytica]